MKLERAEIVPRHLLLDSVQGNSRASWSEFNGAVLRVTSGNRSGWGEASPLAGYSDETLTQACAVLELWVHELPFSLDPEQPVADWLPAQLATWAPRSPAAAFAIETAILDLIAQQSDRPYATLLSDAPAEQVRLAALLPEASQESTLATIEAGLQRGFRCFKMKVGTPQRFAEELAVLEAARARFGESIELRLDANGSFPADQLQRRLMALAAVRPQFLEEPSDPRSFAQIRRSAISLAVDESLRHPDAWRRFAALVDSKLLTTVVLKPTVLGGALACLDWAQAASKRGLDAVISHTYEGLVGWAACTGLALAVGSSVNTHSVAAGLAPHPGLGRSDRLPGYADGRLRTVDRAGLAHDLEMP